MRGDANAGVSTPPDDAAREIRDRALALLARREHSRRELEGKLVRKGHAPSAVAPVLDALEAECLLSDERFAAAYVASRAARGFGPLRIIEELGQRGIRGAAAREACDPAAQEWAVRAARARRKRFGEPLPAEFHERARQARFLAGRGFASAQANAALAARDGDADDDPGPAPPAR